jgi:hypothetical protein
VHEEEKVCIKYAGTHKLSMNFTDQGMPHPVDELYRLSGIVLKFPASVGILQVC